jgi:hypothetical protein
MANTQRGEISWDSASTANGRSGGTSNKDLFLHLENGSNIVRILTNPHQYVVHQNVKKKGDAGKGQKVPCSATQENGNQCPVCALEHPNKSRWYIGVLDRKSGAYKVLDVPWMVFGPILELDRKKDVWGDPTKYDLDIIVNKTKPSQYYTVQPIPHKPLTPAEQQLRDKADLEYLKQKSEPFTFEAVQKILDKILEGEEIALPEPREDDEGAKTAKPAAKAATKTVANGKGKVAHAPATATTVEGNLDEEFPDYGSQPS